MTHRFEARCRVAIAGCAQSPIERHSDLSLGVLAIETVKRAVADAGLTLADVDGFTTGALLPTAGAHAAVDGISIVTSNWLAEKLGINPRFASGFQGYGQLAGGVMLAVNALATGAADCVVFHRALHNPKKGRYHGNTMAEARGPMQWTAPQGYFGPLSMIGLPYNEYLQRYGASREAMAHVLVEARAAGARIPWSYWAGKPITLDDYLSARVLVDPICMLDCDIPVDGVAAFVLTRADRARDLPNPPVYVAGYAQGAVRRQRLPLHWPLDDIMEAGFEIARRLEQASRPVAGRHRRPAALRRLLAVHLLLARSARHVSGRRGASLRRGRRHPHGRRSAGALGRRRTRQRPHARRAADARVLPAALRPRRGAPAPLRERRARVPLVAALRRRDPVHVRAALTARVPGARPAIRPGNRRLRCCSRADPVESRLRLPARSFHPRNFGLEWGP